MTHRLEQLTIAVTQSPGSALVTIGGEIDVASVSSLRRCFTQCMDEGCTDITLEMSGVSFMDSSGIAALLMLNHELEELDGALTLSNPSRAVMKVLDITALSSLFTITNREETDTVA